MTVEKKLIDAAMCDDLAEVQALLRDHPGLDINWQGDDNTALHLASYCGFIEIVKVLLAHPAIDVNSRNLYGSTPFLEGCYSGKLPVVRVLLKDPRVDVTLSADNGGTPLWYLSSCGHFDALEWLIASGRDLGDVKNKKGNDRGNEYTSLEIARKIQSMEVVSLLERFVANPAQTRHELRVKLGVLDELAAENFALVVFLCDGLLQLKPTSNLVAPDTAAAATSRFFTIVKRLPMELQMMLCHHAVGSRKWNIRREDSEATFKSLARILLPSPESK